MIYNNDNAKDRRRARVEKMKKIRSPVLSSNSSSYSSDSETSVTATTSFVSFEERRRIKNRISALNSRLNRKKELDMKQDKIGKADVIVVFFFIVLKFVITDQLEYENAMLRKALRDHGISFDLNIRGLHNGNMCTNKDFAVY
jgi:hypothetical protein